MDMIDTKLLYMSAKGISTFDVEERNKIAKGLVFKGSEYDVVHWAQVPRLIIYGSLKMCKKATFCELKSY